MSYRIHNALEAALTSFASGVLKVLRAVRSGAIPRWRLMGSPLGVMAGGVVGVQHALNGQVNEYSQQSFTTSWLNFITGTTLLLFLLLGGLVFTIRISLDFRQVLGGCILVA